jgi:preprotein translocase subunit YajC
MPLVVFVGFVSFGLIFFFAKQYPKKKQQPKIKRLSLAAENQ